MLRRPAFFLLVFAITACGLRAAAEDQKWDKVRYIEGPLRTTVPSKDWGNELILTSKEINFKLKDGQSLAIPVRAITTLSYGEKSQRGMGRAWTVLAPPVGLLGLLNVSFVRYIQLEYETSGGQKSKLTLQAAEKNFVPIAVALKQATGLPISVLNGEMWVNGVFAGRLPVQLKLHPGTYVVKVTAPGFQDWTSKVQVREGVPVKIRPTMNKR